jgi:hypothetical protein
VPELELLRLDHAPALLAFERESRAYFAASIPDEYLPDTPLAVAEYGLTTLRAATTLDNNGSRAVLARTGFVPTRRC